MASVSNTVIVNGANLGDFGLTWRRRTGWKHAPESTIVTQEIPGTDGALFQEVVHNSERRITISGAIIADTVAQLYEYLDEIGGRLNGFLQLEFSDDTSRYIGGYKQRFEADDYDPGALVPASPYTLVIRCPDPRRYDKAVTSVGAGSDLPLGNMVVKPTVEIAGPATNPTTIALKDHTGSTISTFTMAATLGSGESWLIDSQLGKVEKDDGAGSVTSALDAFSGTLPVLDPEDADFAGKNWPTMEATAGSPASVTTEYKKAWK